MKAAVFPFLVSLALFSLKPSAAAAPIEASFDSPGPTLDRILASIKEDAASPAGRAAAPAVRPRLVKPIVIAVSGLDMRNVGFAGIEFKDILKIWHEIFPGQTPPSEAELRARLAELRGAMQIAEETSRRPQNYLETSLRESAQRNHLDLDVINFPWSRDPDDTERTVAGFEASLLALRDDPATRGQPLCIVAHSWGTVLMHEALMRLQQKGQVVAVQRFVTLGSPLVPHRLWTWLFRKICNGEDHLQRRIAKPQGVRRWVNLWAELDPYSNSIVAADENVRVDWQVLPYEGLLKALLATPKRKEAKKDLALLRNSGRWHFSYCDGFHAVLNSLGRTMDWDVPQKELGRILPVR